MAANTPTVVTISATRHASRFTITAAITSWAPAVVERARLLSISVSAISILATPEKGKSHEA